MKDWSITEYNELMHDCKWQEPYKRISSRGEDGYWYCLNCFSSPPKEIAFCADLSGCRSIDFKQLAQLRHFWFERTAGMIEKY